MNGDIDEAIKRVIESYEKFEESHESILFNLRLLKVIKLIQANNIAESIVLIQKELVPPAKGKPECITEVEK
jgi:hypothetical protein